jgi:hypothetical protein
MIEASVSHGETEVIKHIGDCENLDKHKDKNCYNLTKCCVVVCSMYRWNIFWEKSKIRFFCFSNFVNM